MTMVTIEPRHTHITSATSNNSSSRSGLGVITQTAKGTLPIPTSWHPDGTRTDGVPRPGAIHTARNSWGYSPSACPSETGCTTHVPDDAPAVYTDLSSRCFSFHLHPCEMSFHDLSWYMLCANICGVLFSRYLVNIHHSCLHLFLQPQIMHSNMPCSLGQPDPTRDPLCCRRVGPQSYVPIATPVRHQTLQS